MLLWCHRSWWQSKTQKPWIETVFGKLKPRPPKHGCVELPASYEFSWKCKWEDEGEWGRQCNGTHEAKSAVLSNIAANNCHVINQCMLLKNPMYNKYFESECCCHLLTYCPCVSGTYFLTYVSIQIWQRLYSVYFKRLILWQTCKPKWDGWYLYVPLYTCMQNQMHHMSQT